MPDVSIDLDRCVGSGECEPIAPEVFEVGDDGAAHVLPGAEDADLELLAEAARECPTGAIRIA
ncbi:MAG: ferredoxin [Egibacteraceae bacterium]